MRPESPARTVLDKYLRMAAARYAVAEGRLLPTFCFGQGLSGRDRAAPYALLDDLAPRSTEGDLLLDLAVTLEVACTLEFASERLELVLGDGAVRVLDRLQHREGCKRT